MNDPISSPISQEDKIRKLESLRNDICFRRKRPSYERSIYLCGVSDTIDYIIMMVKKGEL